MTNRYDNSKIRLPLYLESLINLKPGNRTSISDWNNLVDVVNEAIQGLTDLKCPVDKSDCWLLHLVVRKLNEHTREEWEISQESIEGFLKCSALEKFLETRIKSLKQAHSSDHSSNISRDNSQCNSFKTKFN